MTKDVQVLCTKNFKTLQGEMKGGLNKWRYLLCSWFGRIKIVKISILSKFICRFIQYNPNKKPMDILFCKN